jgi:hypothetical protein
MGNVAKVAGVSQIAWATILDQVRSGNPNTILKALETIRNKATRTDLPLLYELVQESDWLVRDVAMETFSRLNEIAALPAIIRVLATDRGQHNFDGVTEFTTWLIEQAPAEATRLLSPLLEDSDPVVRDMAHSWIEDMH